MAATCEKHGFEVAVDNCHSCHRAFCQDCLVFPHGPRQPALCIPCAIEFAGVRAKAGRVPKREPVAPGERPPEPVTAAKVGAAASLGMIKVVGVVVAGAAAGTALRMLL